MELTEYVRIKARRSVASTVPSTSAAAVYWQRSEI